MQCPSCATPVTGRKTFCSHACRQRAYRVRLHEYTMGLELVAGISPDRRRFS